MSSIPPELETTPIEREPETARLQFDAPLHVKEADVPGAAAVPDIPTSSSDVSPRLAKAIFAPPEPPAIAPGSRDARRAVDVAGPGFEGAQHNWVPTGPRNVGGRVRALAVHPTDPRTMYAGPASGGVYRTTDGGETWEPLWHEQPSLAVGAIGICRDDPNTIYVATGEIRTGGGEIIPGDGVYVSRNGGAAWDNHSVPHVPGVAPNLAFRFDAIAVHPTNGDHCWAVSDSGIFRTVDGGRNWTQFEAGVYYSDVAFSFTAGAPPRPLVYLVRARSIAGEATVVRLDAPEAADPAIAVAVTAAPNAMTVSPAPPPPPAPAAGVLSQVPDRPARGKIAIAPSNRNIAYVRFATNSDATAGGHFGVFRTNNARNVPASGAAWVRLGFPAGPIPPLSLDWLAERQGIYNLSIAVSPVNANHVATAMVDLHIATNAAAAPGVANFFRAMAEDLWPNDRAQHADHHQAVFAPQPGTPPGTPPALWTAHDGGVSVSVDWSTANPHAPKLVAPLLPTPPIVLQASVVPAPAGAVTWRKRSHGISATQMYDLTQSPLLPTMYGCGFQDNGLYLTTGGQSWRLVLGGDGGFAAFDPDDPYRSLVTWQSGVAEVVFPAGVDGSVPAPGDPVQAAFFPRRLSQGFLTAVTGVIDGPPFGADTAPHPREAGRVLTARLNRLYSSRPERGERWEPEPAGSGVDVIFVSPGPPAVPQLLRVFPTPGAERLGLLPQVNFVFARSFRTEPFALQEADEVRLFVAGAVHSIIFRSGREIANLGNASAAEVADYVRAEALRLGIAGLQARTCFLATPISVEITSEDAGARITLDGSALAAPAGTLPRLGLRAGAYHGSAGRHAAVTLGFPGYTPADYARNRNLENPVAGPPLELTIQIGDAAGPGPIRRVVFDRATFPNPASIRAGELAAAIRTALGADRANVAARTMIKGVMLLGFAGAVQVAGTAATRLNIPVGALAAAAGGPNIFMIAANNVRRDQDLNQNVGNFNSFDLSPPVAGPLTLTISDGANATPVLTFDAAAQALHNVADLRCVTAEELQRMLQAHIDAAAPPLINVLAELFVAQDEGQPSEIVYAPGDPDIAWVGAEDGTLSRWTEGRKRWETVGDPRMRLRERPVEAIAVNPEDSQTVFAGLAGAPGLTAADDPGFLFRSRNGGDNWDPVGADIQDTAGRLVGVNALEIDTGAPQTVFAATNIGVFRSTDGGGSWHPFNEGLPNTVIRDLAFVPTTRTLRAGAFGRGTYERHVGPRPARDIHLYIRAGELDDGSVRPLPRGPAGNATAPQPAPPAESPDIKVNRDRPPGIGPDELVDGVEFDEDIAHDEPTPGPSNVFVQVHNRGSFPAAAVRIVALWSDASTIPPLLPEDFWARHAAGALANPLGDWTLIGDTTLAATAEVRPSDPRVHTFPIVWPVDLATRRRIGILVLVSSAGDPFTGNERDVAALLAAEPKAAYRETLTRSQADDQLLFLKQTGPTQFSLANPPGPATSAAGPLGLAVGGPVGELVGGSEPFNINVGAPQSVVVTTPPQTITVTFPAGADIAVLGGARAREVASVLNRAFIGAGFPLRANAVPVPAPPPPGNFAWRLNLRGVGEAQLTVGAPGGALTDAAPNLGLPAGGPVAQVVSAVNEPYPLAAGAPQALVLTATNQLTLALPVGEFADPVRATAREVRAATNRRLRAALIPVRAIVPRVDLWVRRSITDIDGRPATLAGRDLADLVIELNAVAPAARPPLFDLVHVHGADQLAANVDNFLYLRSANLGTAPQPNARHRVYQLAVGATPIGTNQIGAAVNDSVPGGGSTIVEFTWNPGAVAAGDRQFVLAIVDHDSLGRQLEPPASFASIEELDAFCNTNTNAAYREFTVGP